MSVKLSSFSVLRGRILWSAVYVLLLVAVPLTSAVNSDATFLILRQSGTPTLFWTTWLIILCCVLLVAIPILLGTWVHHGVPVLALVVVFLAYGALKPITLIQTLGVGRYTAQIVSVILAVILGAVAELLARNIYLGKVLLVALTCTLIFGQVFQAPPSTSTRSSSAAISVADELPMSIVWIVIDEVGANLVYDSGESVREDLQNLHRLSETGTTYLRAVTPGTWTTKALPQMLNGIVSDASGSEINDLYGIFPLPGANLNAYFYSDYLKYPDQCGYVKLHVSYENCNFGSSYYERTKVLVGDLAAVAIQNSIPYFRRKILDDVDLDEFNLGSKREVFEVPLVSFIGEQSSEKSFFAFHHYVHTHSPWNLDRYGHEIWKTDELIPNVVAADENLIGIKQSMRFQSLLRFDVELGRIISTLKSKGLFDSTAIIVTSDHGASVKNLPLTGDDQAERIGDVESTLRETLHVPLIVKFPNQRISQTVSQLHAPGDVAEWIVNQINIKSQDVSMSLDSRINRFSTAWRVDVEDPFGKLAALEFKTANVTNPMATRKPLRLNSELLLVDAVQWFGSSSASTRLINVRISSHYNRESRQVCSEYELVASSGYETLGQLFPEQNLEKLTNSNLWGLAIYDSEATEVVCVDGQQ